MADLNPYATVAPYLPTTLPSWLDEENAMRLESYSAYEKIYWNFPETFRLVFRGSEDSPVYLPSAKQIINTMNRYLGRGFGYRVDPMFGTPDQQFLAIQTFDSLFKRERFLSKFNMNKRYGLIRGDWLWHLTADPEKPEGFRISITPLDPSSYFPITDPNNVDKIWGADIVEQITIADRVYIKRQRYLKSDHPDRGGISGGPITSEKVILELEGWNTAEAKIFQVDTPLFELPPDIPALPIYHIRNSEEPQNPFGSSEIRGLERIIAALNQAISDEEITLAMDGMGMYATDGGPPVDSNGDETEWNLGPGKVVELGAGSKFERVNGVNTVGPYQEHLKFLIEQLRQASPTPDAAIGKVDTAIAESGISLALQMAPILDAAEEKELIVKDIHDQMFFDLRYWLRIYEGVNLDEVIVTCAFKEKLPVNRKERLAELQDLFANGVISTQFYRDTLAKEFGYEFPADMDAQIAGEQAAADPYAARLGEEAGAEEPVGGDFGDGSVG